MLAIRRSNPFHSHRHERTWSLVCLFSLLLVSCCWPSLALDTDVLALGEWRLQLRSNQLDAVFPLRRQSHSDSCGESVIKRKRLLWPRSCECHLSIFPNGTFTLVGPNNNNHENDHFSRREESSANQMVHDENLEPKRLQVHGRWFAPNNPYCATDRFYQSIRLESFPRRQRIERHTEEDGTMTTLQRHQLVLHGRLAGHFQRGRNQRFAVGRITHGKILQENLLPSDKSPWLRPHPILASFVAQQITCSVEEDE